MSVFDSDFLLIPSLIYLAVLVGVGVLVYWMIGALEQYVAVNEVKEEILRIELDEKLKEDSKAAS